MKLRGLLGVLLICCALLTVRCLKEKDLAIQFPMLIVNVALTGITPSDTAPLCLIYYNDTDWLEPLFVQCTTSSEFFNPMVTDTSLYIAVFHDVNNNHLPDAGEPAIGYINADHSLSDTLTKIDFLPFEIKRIDMTLDPSTFF